MGSLGYLFKRHDWPRAPFIIGVILGKIAEDSLQKAIGLFGVSFFWRPISLILIAMILASVAFYFWRSRRPGKTVASHA
jgi:putative tricarboxylic transport membrane protein